MYTDTKPELSSITDYIREICNGDPYEFARMVEDMRNIKSDAGDMVIRVLVPGLHKYVEHVYAGSWENLVADYKNRLALC